MSKIVLNLLDNGLDYILEGIEPIFKAHNSSSNSLKYSVLHIFSGVQLLLKERLKQEHWSLIFQDVTNGSIDKLQSGNFISVYHDEMVKRLKNISKVDVNTRPIQDLRDLRNRFEHFEVNVSLRECEEVIASTLEEAIRFWEKELHNGSTKNQQIKFSQIKAIVTSFEVYQNQRYNKFKKAIDAITKNNGGLVVYCPECGSDYFAIFKGNKKDCKCFVCDVNCSKDEYIKMIRQRESEQKKFSFIPYEPYEIKCTQCNSDNRIRYEVSDDITLYSCLDCLNKEKHSKIEQSKIEFDEWVKNLELKYTNTEVIEILNQRLEELQ